MTLTAIDPKHANEAELGEWLAEQRVDLYEDHGLAFPWASESCGCHSFRSPGHCYRCAISKDSCGACNGSGRVPKALGLEELMEAKPWIVHEALAVEHAEALSESRPPDYTLAALRAIVASVMRENA